MPTLPALVLRWLLLLTSVLLLIGFFMPIMTITKLVFFENSFSIISGIQQLWFEGKYLLFIIIGFFSIVLPLAKLGLLFRLLTPSSQRTGQDQRLLHLMHDYGRWAMLDVMVVAMLIMSVKLGAIASIQIHAGLYVFAAAVLLIMLLTQQVVSHDQQNTPH